MANTKHLYSRLLICVTFALVAASLGCSTFSRGPKMRAYSVELEMSSSLVGSSIQVDVIPAKQSELSDWKSYPVEKYWQQSDSRRRDTEKLTWKADSDTSVVIDLKDPKWKEWRKKGILYLVLIADIPGQFPAGEDDPRRKILSLDAGAWMKGTKSLSAEIQETRIRVITPERPQ